MTDLKTLREVAEKATPGPWVAGIVPRPRAWDRAFVRSVTDFPDGGRITTYPATCEASTLDNAANAAHIAAANPQALLSLLDRIEELEGALTALQGERDRLREALTALVAAADAASWAHNIGTMDARIEAARAALHPEPLGEGGGL